MLGDVVVRPVRADEYEAVGELTVAAYTTIDGFAPGERYQGVLRDVAGRTETAEVIVAADGDGRIVGGVTFVPGLGPLAEFEGADESGMRMLAVDPAAQGRGVGAALLGHVVGATRRLGFAGVVCSSQPAMRAAHRVYDRFGFRRDPTRDWSPEPGIELIAFALRLGPSRRDGTR